MSEAPRSEYARRLDARRRDAVLHEGRKRVLGHARLAIFVAGIGFAWLALRWDALPVWTIGLPVLAFLWGVVRHDDASRAALRATRAVEYYRLGVARLDYDLHDAPKPGDRWLDTAHPYAEHLDLFGAGSLFARLCGAQTRAGEATLARWLLAPAPAEEIRARHAAIDELRSRVDLREDLAVLGPEVSAGLHPDELAAWGEGEPQLTATWQRWAALGLAAAMLVAALAALLTPVGITPLLAVVVAELALALPLRACVHQALHDARGPARDLALLAELLGRIEAERFGSPRLAELRSTLDTEGLPPSRQIARLQLRIRLLEARQNQLFAPLAPLLLWSTQIAFAIDAWRAECGPHLRAWIDAVGEIEALGDLARYAWEEPDDPFPEVVDQGPLFEAEQLGHPLLPRERCVFNDLRLDGELSLLVVSGSNMSGKSTLLRSVGVNTLLALAGAPVRARRLALSPLALGPSLRIRDSLEDGASRFYAEITCLRGIVDLAEGPLPALFLLDEILGGTNSHDRGIGAAAVVRGLVERGSIGLVTTHDLALTKIADALAPRARNVHFQDELIDGEMRFDYRIREGIVTRSNALELMRAVGLEV
ncbi:MAG: DNA mismatch repair protein MutS [Deltaproteobacteria bacterium]|nr:DNA mismatch repair protein MutS [Deltaproteobacteria bacterium]